MLTLKPVILDYGAPLCRRCLNRSYDVHLAHRDCREEESALPCPCCQKVGRVVIGLKLGGHIKLLRK